MAKNAFLEKQKQLQQEALTTGLKLGRQQAVDYFVIAMNDVLGVGKQRALEVLEEVNRIDDYYFLAFKKSDEADYYQSKLDNRLNEIVGGTSYGDKFDFVKRYPMLYEFNYKTGKWK